MARQASRAHRVKARTSDAGMGRFFSPTNVDRYRKLASGAVGDAERHQIMEELAEEMHSFKREARIAIDGPPPLDDSLGSQVGE
jgi:hypothetical protein